MEWREAVDSDEERVFQNATEEQLDYYNSKPVVIVTECSISTCAPISARII